VGNSHNDKQQANEPANVMRCIVDVLLDGTGHCPPAVYPLNDGGAATNRLDGHKKTLRNIQGYGFGSP
jgi:hypothetical protein